jgi:DNA-directed RNA polymerase specialized sigma24 family protein
MAEPKKKKKKKNYCSNDEFVIELTRYHDEGVMSDAIGIIFMNIANRLTGHSYFRYYDQYTKDELVSSAIVRMVSQIDMFDLTRVPSNPFAYFTQTAWNSFVRDCAGHYRQKNIKRKIAINYFTEMESNPHISIDRNLYATIKEMIDEDDHYVTQKKKRKAEVEASEE